MSYTFFKIKSFFHYTLFNYYPVNTYDLPRNINHRAFYPNWKAAVEWQELINEWIGELVYKVLGYN